MDLLSGSEEAQAGAALEEEGVGELVWSRGLVIEHRGIDGEGFDEVEWVGAAGVGAE